MIEACRYVDAVIPDAPYRLTAEFLDEHDIAVVVHGPPGRGAPGRPGHLVLRAAGAGSGGTTSHRKPSKRSSARWQPSANCGS